MRTTLRSKLTLLFMAFAMVLALPTVAFADVVQTNDVVAGNNATKAPGESGKASVYLDTTDSTDPVNGCNATGSAPATINLTSSSSKLTFPNGSSKQITGCGSSNAVQIDYKVDSSATNGQAITVTGDASGGRSGADYTADTFTITIRSTDSTAPVINPTVTGTQGNNGWYTSNVDVSWSVTDPESAVSSQSGCGATSVTSDTNGTTFTCQATSAGGTSSKSVTIKRDATAPVISGANINDTAWRNTDRSASFTASDNLSGLVEADKAFTLTASQESANASTPTTVSKTVTDAAGNSATRSLSALIDKTAPSLKDEGPDATFSQPNAAGWYNKDVTNKFSASDALSGLNDSAQASFSKATAGEGSAVKVASGTVADKAGNVAASIESKGFQVDKTAPSVKDEGPDAQVSTPNAAGWYNKDVANKFSATDGLSGLAAADQSFAKSSSTEGSAVKINSGTVTDKAGNQSESVDSAAFKIDKTKPVISGEDVNDTAWRNTDRSASFTASDNLSGIADADKAFTLTASDESKSASEPTKDSRTVTDQAGNSATRSLSALIDKTKPVITDEGPTPAQPNGKNGWYVSAVSNGFKASDGLSGFVGQNDPYSFSKSSGSSEGAAVNIASGDVSDKAGNKAASIDSAAFKIDMSVPAPPSKLDLVASSDTGDSNTDNLTKDQTPTFEVSAEKGSKLEIFRGTDNTPLGSATANASGVATVTSSELSDGTYTIHAIATDEAGNVSESSATIKVTIDVTVDATAPDAPTGLDLAAASDSGSSPTDDKTNNSTLDISGKAEAASAVKLYDGTVLVGSAKADANGDWSLTTGAFSEGEHLLKAEATDAAGNTSAASSALKVTIDKTAPVITPGQASGTAGDNGWYKSAVTSAFTAEDELSGLANAADASFQKSSGSAEGSAVEIDSGPVSDVAGNANNGVKTGPFKIDLTDPKVSDSVSPDANTSGWHNQNVTVTLDATDVTSGPDQITYSVNGGANQTYDATTKVSFTQDGEYRITYSATDKAGRASTEGSLTVKLDKTAPVIKDEGPTTLPNNNGWYNAEVTNKFGASDALSGLVNANQASFQRSSGIAEGSTVKINSSADVRDLAGNAAVNIDSAAFKIDKTKPTLAAKVTPNPVLLKGTATADSGATDVLSGIELASCDPVDTSTVGAKGVTCRATDKAGNSDSVSAAYNVNYDFKGFKSPIDNKDASGNYIFNVAKAGSAIPMKFSLTGYQGLSIFSTAVTPNPKVVKVACPSSAALLDTIEELATTNSGLTYDQTIDQYNYVWKTQSTYAGSCYKFDMILNDGTHREAYFKFTK